MTIDPYLFMGLTVDSTPEELRKAYYTMSLACHPDKGGSAEAMVILYTAYKWIKRQFDNIKEQADSGKEYEELQKEFDDYIKAQEATKPPPLLNVIAETLGIVPADYMEIYNEETAAEEANFPLPATIMYDTTICAINEIMRERSLSSDDISGITKEDVMTRLRRDLQEYKKLRNDAGIFVASIPHGYGSFMDTSQVSADEVQKDREAPQPPQHAFEKRDVAIYREPETINSSTTATEMPMPNKKDDYTVYNSGLGSGHGAGSLPLTDYRVAYSETNNASSIFDAMCSTEPVDVLYAARMLERTSLRVPIKKIELLHTGPGGAGSSVGGTD